MYNKFTRDCCISTLTENVKKFDKDFSTYLRRYLEEDGQVRQPDQIDNMKVWLAAIAIEKGNADVIELLQKASKQINQP